MRFFRTTFLASISTATTMLCGLITTKIIAEILGPSGMALTGQFYNIAAIITLLATAACTNGIIKYLAEDASVISRRKIVKTVYKLTGITTAVLAVFTIAFSGFLSEYAFITDEYRIVFIIYGLLLFFSIQNVLYSSILNGIGRINEMTILTISTSVLNMSAVVAFAYLYGIKGVLVASSVANVLVWVLGYYLVRRFTLAPSFDKKINKPLAKALLGFSVMTLVTGLLLPVIQFSIRSKIMQQISVSDAGLWQATTRLSDYYLSFVNSVLMIYYLPKLSSINNAQELRKEIRLGYARILPAVLIITAGIWLSRFYIVRYFLTQEFSGIIPLLKLYLIGDILKILSWILAFVMWAKALKTEFISTEIIFAALNLALNFWFINLFGILGTGYAYIILYFIYLVTIFIILRRYLFPPKVAVEVR